MRYLIPALLLCLATGCSSHRSSPPTPPRPFTTAPPSAPTTYTTATAQRAVDLARSLLRTPYRYGGESPAGMDCSGLTSYVYQRLGVQLPRRAEDQADVGRWIAPDELAAGDLVFFGEDRDKPFHVGLVVSASGQPLRMIHSSTSRGVIETHVTASDYWLRRFKFGRRVLP
ncbi:MAG: C40 family peptidase [Acidobacteriota bacterium]